MNPRTILVPLAEAASAEVALGAAFHLARPWRAHVVALSLVADPRDVVYLIGEAPSGRMVEEAIQAAEAEAARRAARDRALFDQMLKAARDAETGGGAEPSAHFEEAVGGEADLVAAFGRTADLIVAARPLDKIGTREAIMIEAALFASGRPVLVPASTRGAVLAERIAILWNDSVEAAHAVAAAAPFLSRAKTVAVLVTTGDATRPSAERLVANLLRHGVAGEIHEVAGPATGAKLADKAAALGATLIVMGGYGHSRLREWVLGGVTRHMLGVTGPALLMAH